MHLLIKLVPIVTLFNLLYAQASVDLKPEDYINKKDGTRFTDGLGHTYEIKKSKTELGMRLSTLVNGKEKWVKHGVIYTLRYGTQIVIKITTWSYGKKDGETQEYHSNGTLKTKGRYAKNIKTGLWERYTDKGKPSKQETYKNNKKNGKTIEYNTYVKKDRQPQFIKHYKDNKKHGLFEQYNSQGIRVYWGNFINDEEEGTFYDRRTMSGQTVTKQFVHGKLQK